MIRLMNDLIYSVKPFRALLLIALFLQFFGGTASIAYAKIEITEANALIVQERLAPLFKTLLPSLIAPGDYILHQDGDVTVERADDFYAVTSPSISLHHKTKNSVVDVGMIAANIIPIQETADMNSWRVSLALPTPIFFFEEQAQAGQLVIEDQAIVFDVIDKGGLLSMRNLKMALQNVKYDYFEPQIYVGVDALLLEAAEPNTKTVEIMDMVDTLYMDVRLRNLDAHLLQILKIPNGQPLPFWASLLKTVAQVDDTKPGEYRYEIFATQNGKMMINTLDFSQLLPLIKNK